MLFDGWFVRVHHITCCHEFHLVFKVEMRKKCNHSVIVLPSGIRPSKVYPLNEGFPLYVLTLHLILNPKQGCKFLPIWLNWGDSLSHCRFAKDCCQYTHSPTLNSNSLLCLCALCFIWCWAFITEARRSSKIASRSKRLCSSVSSAVLPLSLWSRGEGSLPYNARKGVILMDICGDVL